MIKLSTGDIPETIKFKTKSNNLIPFPYSETSRIEEGITYTVNEEDGTVLVNGTATLASNFYLVKTLHLEKGQTYTLSSNCNIPLTIEDTTYKQIVTCINTPQTFTAEYDTYYIFSTVGKGNVIDNITIKPQLEKGSSATSYSRNGQIYDVEKVVYKDEKNNINETIWTKPTNLIVDYPIGSQTITGITWTVNDDNSITANGTATAESTFKVTTLDVTGKKVRLSGCPAGASESSYYMYAYDTANNKTYTTYENGIEFTPEHETSIYLRVRTGMAITKITFNPCLIEIA